MTDRYTIDRCVIERLIAAANDAKRRMAETGIPYQSTPEIDALSQALASAPVSRQTHEREVSSTHDQHPNLDPRRNGENRSSGEGFLNPGTDGAGAGVAPDATCARASPRSASVRLSVSAVGDLRGARGMAATGTRHRVEDDRPLDRNGRADHRLASAPVEGGDYWFDPRDPEVTDKNPDNILIHYYAAFDVTMLQCGDLAMFGFWFDAPDGSEFQYRYFSDPDQAQAEALSQKAALQAQGEPVETTDEAILKAATEIRASSVAWANEPEEFAHLVELTPEEIRKLIAALYAHPPARADDPRIKEWGYADLDELLTAHEGLLDNASSFDGLLVAANAALGALTGNMDGDWTGQDPVPLLRAAIAQAKGGAG